MEDDFSDLDPEIARAVLPALREATRARHEVAALSVVLALTWRAAAGGQLSSRDECAAILEYAPDLLSREQRENAAPLLAIMTQILHAGGEAQ